MRLLFTLFTPLSFIMAAAQDPAITSWILNPGGETGYGGNLTNVQSIHYTGTDVYVSSSCIPGYDIGPWNSNPNTPSNQNFVFKITRSPVINTGNALPTGLGHIGVWRNGVSIFNAKDGMSYNNLGIWERNALVFEGISFDACLGHAAQNGEYHHHVSPNCLYDHMDDQVHSDLIGFAFDGFPIYGAHGYTNTDGSGGISRMRSSYQLRNISDRTTLADGTMLQPAQHGPAIGGQYALGAFIQDFEYVPGSGDLDEHNGRNCITPEYPDGIYAYFVTLHENFEPAFPYVLGPTYNGMVQPGNTGPQSGHNTIPAGAQLYDPTTGIGPVKTPGFTMYPVPAVDIVFIRSERIAVTSVSIFDTKGREVLTTLVNSMNASMEVSDLAPGAYTIRITFADGTTGTRPLIR